MSSQHIARNAGISTVVYVIGSIAGLILVPILLKTLGAAQFGLYVLAQTALSFSTLAGGGLNRGFVRSIIAHSVPPEDTAGPRAVIATGVSLMLMVGSAIALAIALLFPLFVRLFRVEDIHVAGFAWVMAGATAAYVLALAATPYQALLVARGRLDRSKTIEGIQIIAGSTVSGAAALAGFGLKGVGVALFATAVPTSAAMLISALRIDRESARTRPRFDTSIVRELWRFGSRVQLVALAGMINRSVDRASLGILRTSTAVAAYDVADRAAFSLVYTANTLAEALTPRMAGHLARDDADGARITYEAATKVFSVASLTMAGFAVFHARTILTVWLGSSAPATTTALVLLACGYGVGVAFSAANVVATAQAKPTLAMRYSIVQASVNVVLSLLGAWLGGVAGAALGSAASGAVGAVVFASLVERRILRTFEMPGLRILFRAAAITVPVAAVLGLATATSVSALHSGRLLGLGLLGVAFAVQAVISVGLAVMIGLLPADEIRAMLLRVLRPVTRRTGA